MKKMFFYEKLWRMRYLFSVLLVMGLCTGASDAYSQILSRRVNVSDGTIESVFRHITRECRCEFFYNAKILDVKQPVHFQQKGGTVKEILDQMLGNKYTFTEKDNYILIYEKNTPVEKGDGIVIKGKIRDTGGNPLPGATAVIKAAKTGVVSDKDGEFLIAIPFGMEPVLVFSFVGMKTKEVRCANNAPLDVMLEEDVALLDEAIVTGYQEISRSKMTGAVEVITADKIANRGYNFIGEVLKGQLAGVSTRSVSGRPGAGMEIRIRGINSLNGEKNPMWILDGKPLNGDISNINPDDIESITALKDAAATAIYGSRAANGVIVVKTKRGKEGKPRLSVNSSFSFDEAPKRQIEMMDTKEKIAFERSIYADFPNANTGGRVTSLLHDAAIGRISDQDAEAGIAKLANTETDWYKELMRLAHSHSHSISLSGGTETTQYYGSFNYRGLQGIEPFNKYNSGGLSMNLNQKINSWLNADVSIRSNFRNSKQSGSRVNIQEYSATANPYERLYNDDGTYAYDRSYFPELSSLKDGYKYDFNIMEDYEKNTSENVGTTTEASLNLQANIYKGLKFSTYGTFAYTSRYIRKILSPGTYSAKTTAWITRAFDGELPDIYNKGSLSERSDRTQSWNLRNQLEYSRTFGGKHAINLFAAQDVSQEKSYAFGMMMPEYNPRRGLANYPDLSGIDAGSLNMAALNESSESETRSVSFFASASYGYDERYVLSGSFRLDGVDVIDPDNCYTPLWNISGRWNIHKEKFFKNVSFIDMLALRLSYGYTGNIDRNALPFSVLSYLNSNSYYMDEAIPLIIAPANPSVKWERKQDRSFGFETSVFNGRFSFIVNYYNNVVRDLLDQRQLPISSGQSSIMANVSSVRNTGWEFSIDADIIRSKDFSWSLSFNTSINKNKVIETFYKAENDVRPSFLRSPIEGYSANAWFGYRFAGVDPLTGNTLAYTEQKDEQGRPYGHLLPNGRYAIDMENENKDLAIAFLGDGYPPISGGFSTSFRYKRIHLNANFSLMARHMITSTSEMEFGGSLSNSRLSMPKSAINRWRKPGDITDVPVYSSGTNSWREDVYDFKLLKGSYLKCNDISLGYSLPDKFCKLLNVSGIRLNANIREVFTLSTYKIGDPENFTAYGYPNARKYMFSLNIGI